MPLVFGQREKVRRENCKGFLEPEKGEEAFSQRREKKPSAS